MSRELFTMGYEGTTIDTFIGNLQAKRIDCVLDIRALPLSRKPGFSKKKLAEKLCLVGIRYIHLAELGTPKNIREKLKSTRDYPTFFKKMERYLAGKRETIELVYNHVTNNRCCLMCFERLADHCHRKMVAIQIKELAGNGLQIKNI
ncbi:MAG: DUF488 domain-containing protein [Sedimentisphaerales bacterium]